MRWPRQAEILAPRLRGGCGGIGREQPRFVAQGFGVQGDGREIVRARGLQGRSQLADASDSVADRRLHRFPRRARAAAVRALGIAQGWETARIFARLPASR
jgi:hypothetical protein